MSNQVVGGIIEFNGAFGVRYAARVIINTLVLRSATDRKAE